MIKTLEDFKIAFSQIVNADQWIKTHRNNDTGIGKTLEDILEIEENNKDEPDFGDYELKSCRKNSNSLLTLFTKAPEPKNINATLRDLYGYEQEKNNKIKKVLHATLSTSAYVKLLSDHSLKITVDEEQRKILIIDENNVATAYWTFETLKNTLNKKYRNKFVYVYADCKKIDSIEYFKYETAYEYIGISFDKFLSLLRAGKIRIDIRIGQNPDGSVHDHGTGFRIASNDLLSLFDEKKLIYSK